MASSPAAAAQPMATPSDESATSQQPPSTPASAPFAASASSSSSSRHPKLDGVLYHFYSKTSAVITAHRLTHFESSDNQLNSSLTSLPRQQPSQPNRRTSLESQSSTTGTPAGPSRANSTTGSTRRPSKWFALEIDDQDVFREEVRLWRSISTLIPEWLLECQPSAIPYHGPTYVPPMIFDVILDTSLLSTKHVLMIDELDEDGRMRKRVRADGLDQRAYSRRSSESGKSREHPPVPSEDEPLDEQRQSIVLETWRLDFAVHNPPNAPDLPTLYKHATAHFRDVYATATDLPAFALHQRLKNAWSSGLERQRARLASGAAADDAQQDDDLESANLLKIGVRLAVGRNAEVEEGHLSLREPIGSARHAGGQAAVQVRSHIFPAVQSPIGSLNLSVEYRTNVEFYVEDWHVIKSLQEIALDEDYFKPTIARHLQRRGTSSQNSPLSSSPASHASSLPDKPRSLLSVTSYQRQQHNASIPTDNTQNNTTSSSESPQTLRSLPPTTSATSTAGVVSAFGPASSGRPVAGLSSLRANPSFASYSASPTATALGSAASSSSTSSPALNAALASDAAFLTHARRPSSNSGDRKLRSLSMLSTEKDSSHSSLAQQTPSGTAGRPILTRAAASVIPRSGSYSPSSPSPLAQQLYAQQSGALLVGDSQSGRLSSSPSFRTGFVSSVSPSLRSVFQNYTPSHSQTSISSLSRTPPRSLLDGGQGHPSLGLRGIDSSTATTQRTDQHNSTSSTSAPSTTTISSQPTVGPRMIKRYSSTFQYRQGRQGASGENEGGIRRDDGTGSAGTAGSSAGGLGDVYSRSWQARIEGRQAFSSRSIGREEGLHFPSSSPASIRHASHRHYAGQEEELDDFVRMLDSKPSLGVESAGTVDRSSPSHVESVMGSSTDRQANILDRGVIKSREAESEGVEGTDVLGSAKRFEPMQLSSVLGFTRNNHLNRAQVDDMLSKMQDSMREFSTSISTSRGSPASAGAATSSSGAQSQPDHSPSSHITGKSPATMRSPLSRGSFTATRQGTSMKAILSGDEVTDDERTHSPAGRQAAETNAAHSQAGNGRRGTELPPGHPYEDDDVHHDSTARQEQPEDEDEATMTRDSREESRMSHSHPGRQTSRGSLELFGGTSHSYDPLDDEAAGRLELASDEVWTSAATAPIVAATATVTDNALFGDENGGANHSMRAPLRVRSPGMRSTSTGPMILSSAVDEEARQRQASDYELARNFTQTVGNRGNGGSMGASAGRTGAGAWRLRGLHQHAHPHHHHPHHHHAHHAASNAQGGAAYDNPGSTATTSGPYNLPLINRGRHTPLHHTARNGIRSAGPTSRSVSPTLDDD